MSLIIRIPSASWSGKGFPNVDPFITTGLVYGFDMRQRATMLTDVTGNYTITPKRNDPKLGIANVTDATILVPVDNNQGVRVDLGYLQSSELVAAFSSGGATQFTIMVVGRSGGVDMPAGKVNGSSPVSGILYDDGSQVGANGFTLDFQNLLTGKIAARIENSSSNLNPEAASRDLVATNNVVFLTYDGTNWTITNKTLGVSATGTNTSLAVSNPITVASTETQGKVNLGGNANNSTLHGYYPVIHQQAKWNRVLSGAEMDDQYARCKASRSSLVL